MSETRLDVAYLAQAEAPEREDLWLRFLERVCDAELFLLLEAEAEGQTLRPRVFELDEGRFALAFDTDERLAAFLEAPAPYAALSGRRLAAMLARTGVGIGLNIGVAPSAVLLPAEAVDWLAQAAAERPVETEVLPGPVAAPGTVAPGLIAALEPKLAAMAPLIGAAHLVEAEGPVLVLEGVPETAQPEVAAAVAEAVRFGSAGDLGLAFAAPGSGFAARVRAVGRSIELPQVPRRAAPVAPGGDPARPPILR